MSPRKPVCTANLWEDKESAPYRRAKKGSVPYTAGATPAYSTKLGNEMPNKIFIQLFQLELIRERSIWILQGLFALIAIISLFIDNSIQWFAFGIGEMFGSA